MLDYDSLLNIFNHCRLEDVDNWNRQLTWRKLAHVCRKWRYLIYDSSSLLDMYLLLTNGSPPMDSLAYLPPMPLVIECRNNTTAWVLHDEENIFTGLQRHDRVRRITLQAPSPSLRPCLIALNDFFPQLEYLSIESTTKEEAGLVLPGTFRAPNLRHLAFHDIGLPEQLSLSVSTTALVTLTLTHIPAPFYLHPGHLVTQLQDLPYLEELSIGFAVPMPRPSAEGKLLPAPIPRVTLPILKRFTFRGVVVYLENLVAQIYAPLLEQLDITLLFQLAFTLVNLTQFIHTTERLSCPSARVLFRRNRASIVTSNGEPRDGGVLTISVICEPLDWQIDSITQVCGALAQVLSSIEELTLDLEAGMPLDGENALDSTLWRELLLPFRGVRRLHIGSALTSELSDALTSDAVELLPDLQDLEVQLEIDDAYNAFSTFIETREREGRLVRLLAPPRNLSQKIFGGIRRTKTRTDYRISNTRLSYMRSVSKSFYRHLKLSDLKSSNVSIPKASSPSVGIIGSGMAGLYAALLLQRTGYRVQIFEGTTTPRLLTQTVLPEGSSPTVPSTSLVMPYRGRPGHDSEGSRGSKGPRGSRKYSDFSQSVAQNRKLRKRHGYR